MIISYHKLNSSSFILIGLLDYKQDLSQHVSDLIRQDWRAQEPHWDTLIGQSFDSYDELWQYGHA